MKPTSGSLSSRKKTPGQIAAHDKAALCARYALDKKAYDIKVLHIGILSPITEYFVICSGRSVRQVRAIAEHIQATLKHLQAQTPIGVEGLLEGTWILLDYDDVVVHVFYEPTRDLYCLENLWSEVPRIRIPEVESREREGRQYDSQDDEAWDD